MYLYYGLEIYEVLVQKSIPLISGKKFTQIHNFRIEIDLQASWQNLIYISKW